MPKPFNEIETDAEYLRAVGMGPETHLDLWLNQSDLQAALSGWPTPSAPRLIVNIAFHDTDPSRKWDNLANVLRVLGPETDRRGWKPSIFWLQSEEKYFAAILKQSHLEIESEFNDLPHLALLEAFYTAHAQGETA